MPYRQPTQVLAVLGLVASILPALAACGQPAATPSPEGGGRLVLAAPPGSLPQSVLARFDRRGGMAVELHERADVESALRAGEPIDLALLPTEALPGLIEDALLAPIDYARVPGFRAVPASFRDLAFDPGNRHSVPYRYGVTGLVLPADRLEAGLPASWDALLDPVSERRLALHARPREILGAALLAEGLDANAEDPEALGVALARWLALDPERLQLLAPDQRLADALARADAGIGRATDLAQARATGMDVIFVVPAEGGLLWIDHLVIPSGSREPDEAAALIEHLLQPEVAAEVARAGSVALANDQLAELLAPELQGDRAIWPEPRLLRRARLLLPLSAAGRALHEATWDQLRAAIAEPAP